MGPNQTYKLLYSKGNHQQNEKTTYRSSLVVQQVKDLALSLQGMAEKQNKTTHNLWTGRKYLQTMQPKGISFQNTQTTQATQ